MTTPPAAPLPAARRRRRNPWPSIAALVVLAGLVAYAIYGSLSSNIVFFVTPTEYRQAEARYEGKILRLGGLVKAADYDPRSQKLAFTITDGTAEYPVRYVGAVSNLFKNNNGVVVEGRFQGPVFEARTLLVKHSEEYSAPKTQSDIKRLLEETK